MNALSAWNGGVILISHDERFITSVAKEVRAASDVSAFDPDILRLAVGVCGRNRRKVQRRCAGVQGLLPRRLYHRWNTDDVYRALLSATSRRSRKRSRCLDATARQAI